MKRDIFLGRRVAVYRIDKFLGEGGFAYVYRARDTSLDIDVALKVLKPAFAYDEVFEESFRREAHRAAKFRHPNVVAIHYAGKDDDVVFFSMDFLETGLKDFMKAGRPVDADLIIKVGMDVASALQFAHTHEGGIVHRDLKPDNILFDRHGNAVVTDFGISEAATTYTAATGTTVYVGTPKYMSPEQARGQRVDHRSDIYSLGVTLYEMATAVPPFTGRDWFELGRKHIEELPAMPREKNTELDPDLERIILKCLQKNPGDRYQSAEQLRSELAILADGSLREVARKAAQAHAPRSTAAAPSQASLRRDEARDEQRAPAGLYEATTLPPRKRRGAVVWIAALIVLAGTVGAYAADVGGFKTLGEDRLPLLANLPYIGTGSVYATGFMHPNVEGGAPLDAEFNVTFSGPIDPSTASRTNVSLIGPDSASVPLEISVSNDAKRITVRPASELAYRTPYTLVITEGLLSAQGTPIRRSARAMNPGASWDFTTRQPPPDTDPPYLAESSPPDNARRVPASGPITLTFSEALDPNSVNEESVRLTDAQGTAVKIEFLWRQGFRTLLVQPGAPLELGTKYTLQLGASVTDEAGNGMPPDSVVFTTVGGGPTPPVAVRPATLSVSVLPQRAMTHVRVELDGQELGNAPKLNIQVEANKQHRLRLIAQPPFSQHKLVLHERIIQLNPGQKFEVREEVRAFGSITVQSRPPAEVFIDGEFVGSTPQAGIPLYAGTHKLELHPTRESADRFGIYTTSFVVQPFQANNLGTIRLPPRR